MEEETPSSRHPSAIPLTSYNHRHHRSKDPPAAGILLRLAGSSLAPWLLGLTSVAVLLAFYSSNSTLTAAPPDRPAAELHRGGEERRRCDMTDGAWVRDAAAAYTNLSCPTIPESKNCEKYGKDMDYTRWRWEPQGCALPRFDARRYLALVRNKSVAFVGDSVARNHYESLLCLLSQEETPTDVYRDADDRFRTWHFPAHNFTLKVLWTRFFVEATERLSADSGAGTGVFDLDLGTIDASWTQPHHLRDVDVAVLSNGHWFFRPLYLRGDPTSEPPACVFCSEPNVTAIPVGSAIAAALRAALAFLSGQCRHCRDSMLTVVRTFSPAHFENGSWDTGGYCNRTRPGRAADGGAAEEHLGIEREQVMEVETAAARRRGRRRFEALRVTGMMVERGDGHPGTHWNNEWMKGYNDCVHWCLPGPIDVWNELLQEILERRGVSRL